jgi:hypothetical protein
MHDAHLSELAGAASRGKMRFAWVEHRSTSEERDALFKMYFAFDRKIDQM